MKICKILLRFETDSWKNKGPVVQALKDKYGSAIRFYPIQVGDAPEGRVLFQQISEIGGDGFYSTADDLPTDDGIAAFVKKVFLTKETVPDRKDSDKDGVYDDQDHCPGTPAGARVNAAGCWSLDAVLFDFDRAEITPPPEGECPA